MGNIPQLRVPEVGTSGQQLQLESGQGASVEAFGGGLGRGLQDFGSGVYDAGTAIDRRIEASERVRTLRSLSEFESNVNTQLTELKKNAPLETTDLEAQANSLYTTLEQDFLKTVAPRLQEEFSVRTSEFGQGVRNNAREYQNVLTDSFFTSAAQQEFDLASTQLGLDPTVENLEAQRLRLTELIEAADISEPRKEQLRAQLIPGLERIAYKQAWVDKGIAEEIGVAGAIPIATDLIQEFDGGTDEEAADLAQVAEQAVRSVIGDDVWSALPARARGALMSLATDVEEIPQAVIDAAQEGDLVGLAEAVAAMGGERRQMEAARILMIGPDELGIDANPAFNNLDYETRVAIRTDALNDVAQQVTAQRKAQAAMDNAKINNLMVGLYDGTAGLTEIDQAREEGWLTDIEDIEKANKLYEDRVGDVQLTQLALAKLNSGQAFDPTSMDDKKALNALVGAEGLAALQKQDSAYFTNALLPLVAKAQDIPTDVSGLLTGMIRSKEQSKALWALDALAQIQEVAPEAFAMRTDTQVGSDVNFWNTRKDFLPQDELLAVINQGLSTEQRQQNKILADQAADLLSDPKLNLMGDIQSKFGMFGGFLGIGAQPAALPMTPWAAGSFNSDFSMLFQDEFQKYGDANLAKEAALKSMNRVWGVSVVSGAPKLMRYPPEKYYPAFGNSHDWMGAQLRSEGLIAEDEGFELVSDNQTEAEIDSYRVGGEPPSYILVKVKNGQPSVITGADGLPVRQYFEPSAVELEREEAWRNGRRSILEQQNNAVNLGRAGQNSINTGMPVPADAFGALGAMFAGGDDAAAAE